jgi:hypothetical protein
MTNRTYCSKGVIIWVDHGSTVAYSKSTKAGQGKNADYPLPVRVSYLPSTTTLILFTALSPSRPLPPPLTLMFWALYLATRRKCVKWSVVWWRRSQKRTHSSRVHSFPDPNIIKKFDCYGTPPPLPGFINVFTASHLRFTVRNSIMLVAKSTHIVTCKFFRRIIVYPPPRGYKGQ